MRRLLSMVILAGGLLAAGPAHADEQTVTLEIRDMTCASCPFIVKRTLAAVPGVRAVEVLFAEKIATVTFDDAQTSVAALTEATANAGYPSTVRK